MESDENIKILIENQLYTAVSTFHDCGEEKTKEYTKKEIHKFCEKYNLKIESVIEYLDFMFEKKRQNTKFKYEKYANRNLYKICGVKSKGKENNKQEKV